MDTETYLAWLSASIRWPKGSYRGYADEDGNLKDRVIKHDVMHILLATHDERSTPVRLKFEDEYALAIIQSVLEGTGKLSKISKTAGNFRCEPLTQIITTDSVREETITRAVAFIRKELEQEGRPLPENFRDNLSDSFIDYYLKLGECFKNQFRETYGTEFVSMKIDDFIRIPVQQLQNVYNSAAEGLEPPSYRPAAPLRNDSLTMDVR